MKVYNIYFSPTGSTQKITSKIATTFSAEVKSINLNDEESRKQKYIFDNDDVLVLGLPVYGGRIPHILEDVLKNIKGNNTLAITIAVYGNRDFDDALLEMNDIISKNSITPIASAAFIGEHTFTSKLGTNRPDTNDLELASKFAKDVLVKIDDIKNGKNAEIIKVKGNYPYKERKPSPAIAPKTYETCFDCMLCVGMCPVFAIDNRNPREIDASKCIKCSACIKACPVKAKYFDEAFITPVKNMLENNFMERKTPTIFI